MLHITTFTFNPFQENTYLISNDENQCWIVDPGISTELEQKELLNFINAKNWIPQSIINTHTHIDHILGVDFLAEYYKIPFFIHEKEIPILTNAGNTARMFGFQFEGVKTEPNYLSEKIKLGKDDIEIKFVPGHSPGSIAFYSKENNWIISGDTLFEGSIGRTDLPFGNYETLLNSIQSQILILPDQTIIYSGHGNPTNIKKEKTTNPFLIN
jgi:glyoxylase-like metal-dependent hydrolase (beta-lactamase superfamily II)